MEDDAVIGIYGSLERTPGMLQNSIRALGLYIWRPKTDSDKEEKEDCKGSVPSD